MRWRCWRHANSARACHRKKRAHELEDLHEEINRNHIYEEAVAAEMGGRLLIHLDPFAPNVGKEVEKMAAKFRRSDRAQDKGEARVVQWLQAISCFEKEAIKCQTGKILDDHDFASYRRIIREWDSIFQKQVDSNIIRRLPF